MGVGASGLEVGKAVGFGDGFALGAGDGFTLGAEVGCRGDFVGPRDGTLDGMEVGKTLGVKDVDVILGVEEGFPVGSIGKIVG